MTDVKPVVYSCANSLVLSGSGVFSGFATLYFGRGLFPLVTIASVVNVVNRVFVKIKRKKIHIHHFCFSILSRIIKYNFCLSAMLFTSCM